jgi:hypothetical protein
MYVCACVCVCVWVCMCECACERERVCWYIFLYLCLCVCMCVYVCMSRLSLTKICECVNNLCVSEFSGCLYMHVIGVYTCEQWTFYPPFYTKLHTHTRVRTHFIRTHAHRLIRALLVILSVFLSFTRKHTHTQSLSLFLSLSHTHTHTSQYSLRHTLQHPSMHQIQFPSSRRQKASTLRR